jgi:hypothetical protein
MRLHQIAPVCGVLLLLGGFASDVGLSAAGQGQGVVRTVGGDVPFYARTDFVYQDGEWAVVVFYRPPECVPLTFNLLAFYDIPGAFFCGPPTTTGWDIWENGPGVDPAPVKSQLRGLGAVPVWLVDWAEMEAATADGVLTMSELQGMTSLLRGSASFYNESLLIGRKITFVANGALEDGRMFHVQVSNNDEPPIMNVSVVVR